MAIKVRYNGGTQSYYGCSDPTNLVVDNYADGTNFYKKKSYDFFFSLTIAKH